MEGDTDLAAVGALLADRARCRVLLALGDGRTLPASVLASEAGVAASTASAHLARLVDAGLLTVTARGRYRYYALAGPEVAELIETVARLAPSQPVRSLREGTRAHAVRRARTCYDHLAGRLGVALTDALRERVWLDGHDGSVDLDRMAGSRPAGGVVDPVASTLTGEGRRELTRLGLDVPDGDAVRCCVDWTEQRHHISGPHGRALLAHLMEARWLRRAPTGRAVLVTDEGRRGLRDAFRITPPESRREPRRGTLGERAKSAAVRPRRGGGPRGRPSKGKHPRSRLRVVAWPRATRFRP
jgi:DNA-binding transcriptional ArsR family regulator